MNSSDTASKLNVNLSQRQFDKLAKKKAFVTFNETTRPSYPSLMARNGLRSIEVLRLSVPDAKLSQGRRGCCKEGTWAVHETRAH